MNKKQSITSCIKHLAAIISACIKSNCNLIINCLEMLHVSNASFYQQDDERQL